MKYEVVVGITIDELEMVVGTMIEAGWEPQGGIAVTFSSFSRNSRFPDRFEITDARYYQAMVKHDMPFTVTASASDKAKLKESLRKYVGDEFVNAVSTIRVEP